MFLPHKKKFIADLIIRNFHSLNIGLNINRNFHSLNMGMQFSPALLHVVLAAFLSIYVYICRFWNQPFLHVQCLILRSFDLIGNGKLD